MKLRLTVLFYNDKCIEKEKEQKLIHGEDYQLPLNDYSKRLCIFYEISAVYPHDIENNYSCVVSGGQTFVVCMPIDKLEERIEKAKIESILKYSLQ